MKTFPSLEQRLAQGYLDMMPSFVPDESAPVSAADQAAFYHIIKGLYQLAYDEPLLFSASLHPDDAFPTRFKKSYMKPTLITDMRKFTQTMDAFLNALFQYGRGEAVKFKPRQRAVLSRLGVNDLNEPPAALSWMAGRENASLPAFSHCLFSRTYPYASEIYARLLGESAFRRLEKWMLEHGYKRYVLHHATASDCNLILTIVNPARSPEPPRGGFEYKITHTGVSMQYDFYTREPATIGICIPNGMKPYLAAFPLMERELQAFVIDRTKKCDMCRYCVQTDHTKTRPLAHTLIDFNGAAYQLCHFFPGYQYSWTSLDEALADRIIMMLSFMDGLKP